MHPKKIPKYRKQFGNHMVQGEVVVKSFSFEIPSCLFIQALIVCEISQSVPRRSEIVNMQSIGMCKGKKLEIAKLATLPKTPNGQFELQMESQKYTYRSRLPN